MADRLSSTLFVAALVHGVVILGITFTAGPLGDTQTIPTLKVTLVADTGELEEAAKDADYLAQRSQRGSGQREPGNRPTTAISSDGQLTQEGDPLGADLADGTPRELVPGAEQLVTRNPSQRTLDRLPQPSDMPAEVPQTAAALIDLRADRTLAAEIDLVSALPNADDADPLASPDTRASSLARYLDAWRRRVEQIGTVNFPDQARTARATQNPTLEVSIDADGRLKEIVVRRSSGDSVLDQAALGILRMAAPFDPLPAPIRQEYDVLRFAYEWEFDRGLQPDGGEYAVEND